MRPLPLEAGLQALKAQNGCGSNWDPFAPSPCKLNLASVVGGQRGRRVLHGFEFIDTGDDVDTNGDHQSDSEGEECPFNWFGIVAEEGRHRGRKPCGQVRAKL